MTKSADVVRQAFELLDAGRSKKSIARELGVSRAAVLDWSRQDPGALVNYRRQIGSGQQHDRLACTLIHQLPRAEYAYLFGQYLGDRLYLRRPKGGLSAARHVL